MMMTGRLCSAGVIAAALLALAWGAESNPPRATTLICVRHAEKTSEAERDPDLNDAGRARAEQLGRLLSAARLDAIYATDFRRTRATVAPVAAKHKLEVQGYDRSETFVEHLRRAHAGHTVLVCGHSNTIPELLRLVGVDFQTKVLEDNDDLFVVTLPPDATAATTCLRLRYRP